MPDYSQIMEKYRFEHGLSQSDMAKKLGISQQVYSNYEGGKKKHFGADFIVKYKEVTGIDLLFETKGYRDQDGKFHFRDKHGDFIADAQLQGSHNEANSTDPVNVILKVAEGNKVLYEANRDLAEANLILARNNERLVAMLEKRGVSKGIELDEPGTKGTETKLPNSKQKTGT